MSEGRSNRRLAWRLIIAAFLLLWIFHAIFQLEGSRAWREQGHSWEALTRVERWQMAWREGPRELWGSIRQVAPGPLALSLVFMGMTLLLGVIRWRMVMRVQGLNLSFLRASEISLVAHFFNSFLLGSTGGDVLKAYYAARETRHKKTEAVVTVVVDRLLGLFAMLLFAALMMLPNWTLLVAHRRLAAVALFVLGLLLACGVVAMVFLWGGLSRHLPRARDWLRRLPKGDLLERAIDAGRLFGRHPMMLVKALGVSMALNLFCVLQIWALARGLNLDIALRALFVIVPVVVCISALPITPSGLGVRENLYVLMLAVPEIAVPATHALSLSLLAYAGFLAWSLVGGLVYLSRKERDQLDEFTRPEVQAPPGGLAEG